MATNTRLDKAIIGLKKILERYQDFKNITIDNNQILVNNNKPEYWGTFFYIAVVLLLPTILMMFEIAYKSRPYYSIIVLIAFLLLFGRDLYKMVRNNVSLKINFKDHNLDIENNNGVFKRFFTRQTISFDEISKVEIVNKAVHSKYSATRWKEVTIFNKKKQKFILASFDEKYPDNLIAQKVKFLFDVIIWTGKNSKVIS